MATYTRTKTVTQYASAGWTYISFDAITPAAGETFVRWKAEETPPSAQIELRDLQWNPKLWGSWYTDRSMINCAGDFSAPKIQARLNTPSGTGILNTQYTLTVEFEQSTFGVTVTAGTGGTAGTNKSSAAPGETVTITCSPANGYTADVPTAAGITFNQAGTNIWTFTMPSSAVTVSCTFSKTKYAITAVSSPAGAGTVSASKASAEAGETITLTQTPAEGYVFNGWSITPAATISGGSFSMPASAVTVTANYLKKSTCTLSSASLTGGGNVTMNIVPGDLSFSHKYQLSFGTNMETAEVSVAAGVTSVTIQVPESWSNYIPNAASKGSGTLTLKTYRGTQLVADYTVTGLTYNVPASAVPSVGAVTASVARTIGGTTYADVGDVYTQNKSGVRVQASASGALGSTVAAVAVALSGYSDAGHQGSASAASIDWTSGLLTVAGSCVITVTATDSRGRTGTATATISVLPYNRPGGTLKVKRVDLNGDDDPLGDYADYELTKSYSAVGTNSLSWSITSRGSTENSPAASGHLLPSSRQTFGATSEYTISLTLTDAFETVIIQTVLPTAQFMIHVNAGGDRIAFMKAANDSLDKHGKDAVIEFSGNAQIYVGSTTLEQYILNVVNGN